jgi:hypothetical protein
MDQSNSNASDQGTDEGPRGRETPKLRLTKPHPLIRRTLDQKPVKDSFGSIRQPDWPGVDARVSNGEKRNALIVLDRLFKALEKIDVRVEVVQHDHRYGEKGRGTYAQRGRDKTPMYVTEEYTKVPHVPTAKELREADKYPVLSKVPKWDSVPTGKLTLVPGGVVDLSSEEALAQLIAKAVEEIVQHLDRERSQRKAAEEARNREYQRQKAEQEEKTRVESLYKASDSLHRYRLLMAYIEEVRRFGRVPEDQRRDGQTLEEWIRWAKWRARMIHPLG